MHDKSLYNIYPLHAHLEVTKLYILIFIWALLPLLGFDMKLPSW